MSRYQKCCYSLTVLLLCLGCRSGTTPQTSFITIPDLPLISPGSVRREAWQQWADQHLQDGDVLFVRGESRILFGLVNFSEVTTRIANSEFSHAGIVARENGQVCVYDTIIDGPRCTPFGEYVGDRRVWTIAIRRPNALHQRFVRDAVQYCRQVVESQIPFDEDFLLNNDRLYCTELVELAFRHSGWALSEPVAINQLPGIDQVSETAKRIVLAATPIQLEQAILVPGNSRIGLWANTDLELLLKSTDTSQPPSALESGR